MRDSRISVARRAAGTPCAAGIGANYTGATHTHYKLHWCHTHTHMEKRLIVLPYLPYMGRAHGETADRTPESGCLIRKDAHMEKRLIVLPGQVGAEKRGEPGWSTPPLPADHMQLGCKLDEVECGRARSYAAPGLPAVLVQ